MQTSDADAKSLEQMEEQLEGTPLTAVRCKHCGNPTTALTVNKNRGHRCSDCVHD